MDFEVSLPSADDLPAILLDLAVPHGDIDAVVAALPSPERAPQTWGLLERYAHDLIRTMGSLDDPPKLSPPEPSTGPYFYVYVFLAVLPHVRAFHQARQIPEDISRLTLADLGRHMAAYRSSQGTGGIFAPWIGFHFRGAIYQLGRLQFERSTLGNRIGSALAAAGLPYGPGDPVLAVHIPGAFGPLTPSACDASFARARGFFDRHFPEERHDLAVCHSWLLDEQLAEYLPATCNIIRFQRRFRPAYQPDDDDQDIKRFVFVGLKATVDELPQRTTLERAIVTHIRAGRHWHGGAGWLELPR